MNVQFYKLTEISRVVDVIFLNPMAIDTQGSFYIFKEIKKVSCFQNLLRLDADFPLNPKMLLPYLPNWTFLESGYCGLDDLK